MSTKKKIVLSGYYGFDNLGDEAILDYLINFLKENDIEPIVLSANPEKTSKLYNVTAYQRFDFNQVYTTLKNSDGLISGGGSLLQDKTSKKSLIYYLIIMQIAKFLKKPFYFYGQGVGPINAKELKFFTKQVLKNATLMSVRDQASSDFLLNEIGLKKKDIQVMHDPVLLKPVVKNQPELSNNIVSFLKKEPVYISVRPTDNDQNVKEAFRGFLDKMNQIGVPIISFPFYPSQDTAITKEIMSEFPNTLFIEEPLTLEQATYILSKSRLVIGMRLHSLILSASQNTPFLGVSYDPKIDAFVKQYNQQVVGDIHTVTAKKLIDESIMIFENESISSTVIEEMNKKIVEKNKAFNEKLLNEINR